MNYEQISRMAGGRSYKEVHEWISQNSRKMGRRNQDRWRGCVT